jgi:phytoene dehydrogenase-like protein
VTEVDAVVVGAGPNGLAAALTLARAGLSVAVFEKADTIGGGARTSELTLPGFLHDVCSAVHPMALASPFFRAFGISDRVEFVTPELSYGHPLDGGRAGLAWRDLDRAAASLGADGTAWRRFFFPLSSHAAEVAEVTGTSLARWPSHPLVLARFGLRALEAGSPLWNARWKTDVARALLTGVMAHSILPMPGIAPAAAGLVLATHGHGGGWPVPIGGSQSIVDAMADDLRAHGGTITTGVTVDSLEELPSSRVVLMDTTPQALLRIAGDRVPAGYASTLARFRYGNAVSKVDFALSGPVPWTHPDLASTATLHLGGSREEIAAGEREVANGRLPASPYVLVAQPSAFDASRAPAGKHVLWAYTHVPAGSSVDATEAITAQIERFAPGFRDLILASAARTAVEYENYDPNYIAGDISGGSPDLAQLVRRPTLFDPWRTPVQGVYLASSSTPPGPGVHGGGGYNAALSALRHEFGVRSAPHLRPAPAA